MKVLRDSGNQTPIAIVTATPEQNLVVRDPQTWSVEIVGPSTSKYQAPSNRFKNAAQLPCPQLQAVQR
jgi:hypothetical protein